MFPAHPETAASVEDRIEEPTALFVDVFCHDNVGVRAKGFGMIVNEILAAGVKRPLVGGGVAADVLPTSQDG